MVSSEQLPVESIRTRFLEATENGPVVVTAPTGSGKSTQIPRWSAQNGRVLVIEPRRVACRGLAVRVAELEKARLGDEVGYAVRDDNRCERKTRIVFATPGVVLRWLSDGGSLEYSTVIIDEFHERGLDVDLLLALLKSRFPGSLVVMSATMNAERVARYLDGEHLHAAGRAFPVEVVHIPGSVLLPDTRGLEERISEGLKRSGSEPGDILVFLPGKAEIARAAEVVSRFKEFLVLEIHGGLTLEQQSRIFQPGDRRRVILATNVAETSITIPGIGVVIDSGLVRRTRYVNGRGFLTLVPVAMDSADQRTGRAGRTSAGVCFRLWSPDSVLETATPPEIYREALLPLVHATAACNMRMEELVFLDPPKDYALESAVEESVLLGLQDSEQQITARGRQLFGLPLDAPLGNLLVEAERAGCLEAAIDLVAVLALGRPLFQGSLQDTDPELDLRNDGCDVTAYIRAMREGSARLHGLNRFVLGEARSVRRRLRRGWGLPDEASSASPFDRRALIEAVLRSDPRSAHVARRRRGRVFWGNGGTELTLARESAVDENKTHAIAVLSSMAIGLGYRDSKIYATCAMPLKFRHLVQAGFGDDRVKHASRDKERVIARIERVYAGKVLEVTEEVPQGGLAREAIAELFLDGRLFRDAFRKTKERLGAAALMLRLNAAQSLGIDHDVGSWGGVAEVPAIRSWVLHRLEALGVSSGSDLALLAEEDLLADDLPSATRQWLDGKFPRALGLGDVEYDVEYDLLRREAIFVLVSGKRKNPPSLATLPALTGFKIRIRHHSKSWVLRQ
jgi:ATP-dependent RNA helicase HrpB